MATHLQTALDVPAAISRLPSACFKLASLTAVIGVSMGIYMGVAEDHSLAPVHVHLNLIGWVSLFLFGLFYKSHPNAIGIAAVVQVAVVSVGYIVMLSGLAGLLLTASPAFFPLTLIGSLLVWSGFVMFFAIVVWRA
ncbi:MAG: hypothetical protein HC788_08440 [Sphingopyxis sp.]|nr:hypothetical protein [Sphingopyxis sp.]